MSTSAPSIKYKITNPIGELVERDLAIVRTLAAVRIASGRQLLRLHFADVPSAARQCRRALARLTQRRLINRLDRVVGGLRGGSESFIYSLATAGQRLAASRGPAGGTRHRPRTPGFGFLAHALAVTELYVEVTELEFKRLTSLIEFATEPACWRPYTSPGGGRVTLKPDAYMLTAKGESERLWFIEMDRGSVSRATLTEQLGAYRRYWSSGRAQAKLGIFPRVLWVVPDEPRRELLEGLIRRQPGGSADLHLVATVDHAARLLGGVE